jgi:hypothetical protein
MPSLLLPEYEGLCAVKITNEARAETGAKTREKADLLMLSVRFQIPILLHTRSRRRHGFFREITVAEGLGEIF